MAPPAIITAGVQGGSVIATKKDFAPVIWAYLACLAVGMLALLVAGLCGLWPPLDALVADIGATLVIFIFSRRYRNSSFYDPYWSVIPPLLVLWWWWQSPVAPDTWRAVAATVLVWFWGVRLTANWSAYWPGLHHEDWRYPLVRERAGRFAAPADFLGIHLFPTLQVFLGCLPLYFVMTRDARPFGWLDVLAIIVTLGAILIEMIADLQLHAALKTRRPGEIISRGLWGWSRHPNYFGELSFWWGLMLFGLAAAPEQWFWIVPGALAMTAMFLWVSVPMLDARSVERRPAYAEHMRRVSALVPWPPRNAG